MKKTEKIYIKKNTHTKQKMSIAYKNLFITPILLCIITFFILKLNGNIDWKWAYIFIPLWFIFGLIFVWTAILFTKYQYKVVDLNSVDYQTMVNWRWYADYNVQLAIIIYDCLLCFSIFICLQLDHTINWDWFYIFIPLWVISLTWFYWWNESRKHLRRNQTTLKKNVAATTVTKIIPLQQQQQHMNSYHQQRYNEIHYFSDNNDIDDDSDIDSPLYIESGKFSLNFNLKTYQFIISIGIIVFNIFLPLQLDKKSTAEDRWSWWIIFLPLWVSLLVWFWSLCSYTFIKTSKSIHVAAVYASQNVPLWIELIIFYITWFIITIFTIVLSIELDHHHHDGSKDKIDPLTIFSPVIILLCINWWLCFAYIFYYKRELSYYNNSGNQSTSATAATTIGILNKDLMNIKINFDSS